LLFLLQLISGRTSPLCTHGTGIRLKAKAKKYRINVVFHVARMVALAGISVKISHTCQTLALPPSPGMDTE